MENTCFVIMPIGTQTFGRKIVSEEALRIKYDYIIKNAIQTAAPELKVIRADEEPNPGSISNDIFTKLMYSKFVIADITYPNPNVFYELGIRHAISSRTILIRENLNYPIPFDISHLRYIEYSSTSEGINKLSEKLKHTFEFYSDETTKVDNQFLDVCISKKFVPTVYSNFDILAPKLNKLLLSLAVAQPNTLNYLTDNTLDSEEQQQLLFQELSKNPNALKVIADAFIKSGIILS